MGEIVKSGYIKRYSKSFLSGGWNKSFLQLHRDSTLCVYKKQGDSKLQGSIFMKDVAKYFAYGEYTAGMPDRPDVPSGSSYDCIMGIPQKPHKKAKIHWFLFTSSNELHDWMTAICSTLPPPPQKEPQVTATSSHSTHSAPPPPVPGGPVPPYQPVPLGGPSYGFENLTMGAAAAPPYPQQQYQPSPQGYYPPQQGYYPPPPPGNYGPPPPHGAYPQQQYYQAPAPGYPQQTYYQPPPVQGVVYQQQRPPYYVQGGYPQQAYGYSQPVMVQQKKKGGFLSSNTGKMAAGVAGGALLGYGASRMMGGGWGMGRWGSWSSFGSCGSFGSFGSCGSFGSFGSFG